MTNYPSSNIQSANAAKRRFRFSLKLLLFVITLAAAGAAFAANYPGEAFFIGFVAFLELLVWGAFAAGNHLGRGRHRKAVILAGLTVSAICWAWVAIHGPGPVMLGGFFGAYYAIIIWLAGVVPE